MANAPAQIDAGVERGELRILEVHADADALGGRFGDWADPVGCTDIGSADGAPIPMLGQTPSGTSRMRYGAVEHRPAASTTGSRCCSARRGWSSCSACSGWSSCCDGTASTSRHTEPMEPTDRIEPSDPIEGSTRCCRWTALIPWEQIERNEFSRTPRQHVANPSGARTPTDERWMIVFPGPLGRVEGSDGVVEGRDAADVGPQPPSRTRRTISLSWARSASTTKSRSARGGARPAAVDGHQAAGPDQPRIDATLDGAADDVEHQVDPPTSSRAGPRSAGSRPR